MWHISIQRCIQTANLGFLPQIIYEICSWHDYCRNQVKVTKLIHYTLSSQDATTHQIWDSYLKEYKWYALDTIILKTRSEVKVTVTWKWFITLSYPKMHPHNKFVIPTSKHIRDMLQTQLFLKLGQRSRSQWLLNGMWHSVIPRCIYTTNLEFLSQRIWEICTRLNAVSRN